MDRTTDRCIIINTCQTSTPERLIYLIITLMALYLSFKRNNGFNLGSFLIALFFPPIYIVYYFATHIANTADNRLARDRV